MSLSPAKKERKTCLIKNHFPPFSSPVAGVGAAGAVQAGLGDDGGDAAGLPRPRAAPPLLGRRLPPLLVGGGGAGPQGADGGGARPRRHPVPVLLREPEHAGGGGGPGLAGMGEALDAERGGSHEGGQAEAAGSHAHVERK